MDPISDELQAADGEDNLQIVEEVQLLDQETIFSNFYNHELYERPQNFTGKSLHDSNVASLGQLVSSEYPQRKIQSERVGQESLNSPLPRIMKAKRRKAGMFEVHGGRIVRSTSRKDRHSKVCTTRGPKDRRVRLSPTTAIQFYDVQDRLGYDRPSKAIDWLMKEAKTAIDALNEPPAFCSFRQFGAANLAENRSPENGRSHAQMQQGSVSAGMIQKQEHSSNADNPIPSFGVFADGDAPLPFTNDFNSSRTKSEAPGENSFLYPSYQQGLLSGLTTTPQILDANREMARLQRIFTRNNDKTNSGNAGARGAEYSHMNSLPLHYPWPPDFGHIGQMFSQREPLQSSFINYSPISTGSPGINFYSEELSNFVRGENEKDKIPVSSENASAYFLHEED